MIENSEIITKLLVALIVAYISIKFVAPILQLLWEQFFNNTQKPNVNLDILIERQKQLLRNGLTKKEPDSLQKKPRANKTLIAYQEYFQQLSSQKPHQQESINDVKKIFLLFDNLQWGEGIPFKSIQKNIEKDFAYSIDQSKISSLLKKLIEIDYLISRKGPHLPSFQEIMVTLELATIANEIFNESISNEYVLIKYLSQSWKISCLDIVKGFYSLLKQESNDKIEVQKNILENKIKINEADRKKIFTFMKSENNKFFQSKKDFLKNLNSSSRFFSILSPLVPPKDKNDLESARKIFYANPETSLEDIKKTYKTLVAARHPDKLSSYGIPDEFEPLVTKNFTIIQQSYDIILEKHNNNENN